MSLFQNLTPEARLLLGAGIMGGQNFGQGLSQGAQMAVPLMQQQKEQAQARQYENATRSWLQKQYPGQDFNTMTPDMVKLYAQETLKKQFSQAEIPALAQEYNFAKQNGFTGSFMDYQKSKANLDGNPNLPAIASEYNFAKSQGFKGTFEDYQKYKAGIDDGKTSDRFKTELDTMKAYRDENAVKTFQATRDGYEKVRSSATLNTAQGDMSMIFGFMKMLDPTSVVREGEFATAKNSGGVSDTIINMYNRARDGKFLTPEQRQQFIEAAETQYKNVEKNLQDTNARYKGLADAYEVPSERFLEQPKAYEPLKIGQPVNVTLPNGKKATVEKVSE